MKILSVCTENLCRSPIAESLLKSYTSLERHAMARAGAKAGNGEEIHPEAASISYERESTDEDFSSRHLTQPVVNDSDLAFTMTRAHRSVNDSLAPGRWPRKSTLCELAAPTCEHPGLSLEEFAHRLTDRNAGAIDITNPMGGSSTVFETCAREPEIATSKVPPCLKNLRSEQ